MHTTKPAQQEYDFSIKRQESINDGFKRIITEQIAYILFLYESDSELSWIVHNSRKSFKRIRSTLRLLRFNMPEGWFKEQNAFFRDLSRQVSEMRDAHVLMETLEVLQQDPSLKINAFNTEELVGLINEDVVRLEENLRKENVISMKHDKLKSYLLFEQWSELGNSFQEISLGLQTIYKNGFKAMQTAYLNPSSEHFHDWRKQVKHLLYSREILEQVWPVASGCAYTEIKELSEMLGLEHDLANLNLYLTGKVETGHLDEKTVSDYSVEIKKKRQKLQRLAEHLGKLIFAESDEFFILHHQKYWESEGL